MALVKKLDNIAASDNKEDKKNKYIAVIQEIFESESDSNVKIFVDHSKSYLRFLALDFLFILIS